MTLIYIVNVENECLCYSYMFSVLYISEWQVQDLCFFDNGSQFLSCNDIVGRDSPDRTIMIWDFSSGAVLSNQIYQVNVERVYTAVCSALRMLFHSIFLVKNQVKTY